MEQWIGLAEVMPTPTCRELDQPAFVNVIGLAEDKDSFIRLIYEQCEEIGLQLVDVDDVERWQDRLANWSPEAEIIEQAESVCEENPFVFGTFFCFDE